MGNVRKFKTGKYQKKKGMENLENVKYENLKKRKCKNVRKF